MLILSLFASTSFVIHALLLGDVDNPETLDGGAAAAEPGRQDQDSRGGLWKGRAGTHRRLSGRGVVAGALRPVVKLAGF